MVGPERLHDDDAEFRYASGRRVALRHARSGRNRINYEEVVPPQRIVYRHGGGEDVEPVQFRQTITFEDLGDRTRIIWRGDFPSAAERDRVIKEYGADTGLMQTLTRLEQYVSATVAGTAGARL